MRKSLLFIIVVLAVLVCAGCVKINLPSGSGGTAPATETQKEKTDFCQKHISDAEEAIKKIKISDADKKAFEVWKQVFFKANGINQDFFDKYVFTSVNSKKNDYYIGYYYKVGDIYLHVGGDKIIVLDEHLGRFQTSSVVELLANPLPPKTRGFNEPHPTLGDVPRFGINNFDWGSVTVTKLKFAADGKTPPKVVCQELVNLLKTCRADIQPGGILGLIYKPALGEGWLDGYSENYFDDDFYGKKECAGATVSIFGKEVVCSTQIKCTAGITP